MSIQIIQGTEYRVYYNQGLYLVTLVTISDDGETSECALTSFESLEKALRHVEALSPGRFIPYGIRIV